MSAVPDQLFGRRVSLLLVDGSKALDLSEMHITFRTSQDDEESPSNCEIRVHNLSEDTVQQIRGEYSRVVLQAGYFGANFGVIFDGTIKQFRIGRESELNTYLDILAADGDAAYNYAVCSQSLAANSTSAQRIAAAIQVMSPYKVTEGSMLIPSTGGILPRGKVLFGLAKAILRQETQTAGATWSISNGEVNVIPLEGYLPGEAVVLTSRTGMLGRPEQTQEGIRARCLINPRILVGGLVRIDNKSINQTVQQKDAVIPGAQLAFNKFAGIQQFADVSADGLYRVYVAEHEGDSRGTAWWTDLVLLTVDAVTLKVKPYG